MTTTTATATATGMVQGRSIEKQMGGCMAGFFHLFDRGHLLSGGKRLCPKRLPPSSSSPSPGDSTPGAISSIGSPAFSGEIEKPEQLKSPPPPSPEIHSPAPENTPKSPLAVSSIDFKESMKSPWKFSREAPRLSLDSRAVTDAKGSLRPRELKIPPAINSCDGADEEIDKQRRSPSVIARLMGLEPLPAKETTPENPPELRRSVSESRSRDLMRFRFFDTHCLNSNPNPNLNPNPTVTIASENNADRINGDHRINRRRINPSEPLNRRKPPQKKKSYFDSADFFPEPPKQTVTVYGEIERRLKMRGIEQPSKDLEALKQILEALQLKGLLHRRFHSEESPIVVMKPVAKSPAVRRKGVSVETQRKVNETTEQRRGGSPVRSPRVGSRRSGSPKMNRVRSTGEIRRSEMINGPGEDEASSISGSSFSTSSYTDTERGAMRIMEENREGGRSLLERCDKLLHSIAEMTAATTGLPEIQQPSPVSVLDSSFYKEESSPSPVKKRSLPFKDQAMDVEDGEWSPLSSLALQLKPEDADSDDPDFNYVSEIIRASNYFPDDHTNLFLLLEKQHSHRTTDKFNSKISVLQRKLIFDTVTEILDRNQNIPPWKSTSPGNSLTGSRIWSEFQRVRDRDPSEDLFETICKMLKKDLAGDSIDEWQDCHMEVSEVVLNIERLIFKDLINETIWDLAVFTPKCKVAQAPRRKLLF